MKNRTALVLFLQATIMFLYGVLLAAWLYIIIYLIIVKLL